MPLFSANLGFLWSEHPLPQAIRLAKKAGFDAVECHWPYAVPTADINVALKETGLSMLGLNTRKGDVALGENGLAALPGREADARAAIDESIAYATAIGARKIHVMAGFANGAAPKRTFIKNLRYATKNAAKHGLEILLEPLSAAAAPGYFLNTTGQAIDIIEIVGAPNLKLMFDCFHVQMMEGDLSRKLTTLLPHIGHIQFAAAPDRGRPDLGEINYRHIFQHIDALGYAGPLGAEYRPGGPTEPTLGWMKTLV